MRGIALALFFVAVCPLHAQEKSVKPGINKPFENPDVKDFLQKFEGESREIAVSVKEIVAACKIKPGMIVADVGAGTGLFTRKFALEVGEKGKVYAVDIASTFLRHIEKTCEAAKIKNVETIQCDQFSTKLPKNSTDLVFICDTYHHFEFPERTMQSIHDALRPGGRIVLIDFHRIKGKSREFVMGHVRAGQEVFVREITSAGFKATGEEKFLKENYFVHFEKMAISAGEPKVQKGLPYAEPKNTRQMLDVYAPAKGKNLPVVLWIHGGGWRAGDKASVQKKPQAFVDKGYVFVATNHRFFPNVTVKEMTGDIAKAIRWIHDHAKDYGGDPKSIFVMGHSSGAHLAALVCTDDRYLKAEGLPLSIIKGCMPVDVSVYDIPKRLKDGGSVATATFTKTFGDKEESQREYSPAMHVVKGKNIPPFLILHVADRPETKIQANWLAEKLKDAGIPAEVVAAEGTNHGTINANLGLPDDRPTEAMWAFLAGTVKKKTPAGKSVNGLQLSLTADTTEIQFKDGKLGKPAALKLTFTNVSDKTIKFNAFDFHFSLIKGEVKAMPADSVEMQRLAAGRVPVAPKAGDFLEIKPGQSWSYAKELTFPGSVPEGSSTFAIYTVAKPGEMRIRFTYSSQELKSPLAQGIWTGELVSNEIVITAKK